MHIPENFILLLGTLAYMSALVITWVRLSRGKEPLHGTNLILILAGWFLQSFGLWLLGMEARSCPVRNPFQVLQFISWSIVILYLFTGQVFRLSLFGSGSATLAAIIGLVAFLLPGATQTEFSHIGGNPRIEAHAAMAFLSYGIFGLLAVLSALYLLQNYSLKTKKYAGIFRFLPSIVEMDTVLLRLLIVASLMFTVSVGIGALYWIEHLKDLALPKLIFTVSLWIAYWIVLILRLSYKLHGSRLAWTCIGLFIIALFILWPVEASRDHGVPQAMISKHISPDDVA